MKGKDKKKKKVLKHSDKPQDVALIKEMVKKKELKK